MLNIKLILILCNIPTLACASKQTTSSDDFIVVVRDLNDGGARERESFKDKLPLKIQDENLLREIFFW